MPRVLITGVRGKTGVPLAALLLARGGVEVRGGSSDPSAVGLHGVVPTAFSWDDPAGWPAAVADVDAVFVVRPDRADAPDLVGDLVDLLDPGAHVVLLSGLEAGASEPIDWAVRVEHAVRERAPSWTVVRPSWFMQVLDDPRFFGDDVRGGDLPFADAGAPLAWIDARDIAAVAEQALLDRRHHGDVLEITGPASLTLPEVADVLTAAIGRSVTHTALEVEEAIAGSEGFDRELFEATLRLVQAGVFATVTDTVERVTGAEPRTLEQYAADTWSAT